MTIRAHRRKPVAVADALAVNALHECLLHGGMALAAGAGNIELVDRRFLIVGRKYLV